MYFILSVLTAVPVVFLLEARNLSAGWMREAIEDIALTVRDGWSVSIILVYVIGFSLTMLPSSGNWFLEGVRYSIFFGGDNMLLTGFGLCLQLFTWLVVSYLICRFPRT